MRKEPIRHTCPDIDYAIKQLKGIISEMIAYQKDAIDTATNPERIDVLIDEYTLSSWVSIISEISDGRNCYLENLRDANSTLRQWGNDLVSELENQDDEIESLQKELDRRENELSLKEDMIDDMKSEIKELNRELSNI